MQTGWRQTLRRPLAREPLHVSIASLVNTNRGQGSRLCPGTMANVRISVPESSKKKMEETSAWTGAMWPGRSLRKPYDGGRCERRPKHWTSFENPQGLQAGAKLERSDSGGTHDGNCDWLLRGTKVVQWRGEYVRTVWKGPDYLVPTEMNLDGNSLDNRLFDWRSGIGPTSGGSATVPSS